MFKISKESKITFFCLLTIPLIWIGVNHFGLIDGWKIKSVDLRLSSNIPGSRGQLSHNQTSSAVVIVDGNKTIPKIPKVVYVNFDSATLGMDDVGERPWDRAFFRDMSMALLELGKARVLAFDFAFTPKSVSKMVPKENSFRSDKAMGELVLAYPDNVVLGNVYSGVSTPFVNDSIADPFPPFFMSGYSNQTSQISGNFHYPESPTYPMHNYLDDNYIGRAGSFTVPPFRESDNIPRWVPIWFPAGGKAHAYNILGGKASNLPLEMPSEHGNEISSLQNKLKMLDNNLTKIVGHLTKVNTELTVATENRDLAKKKYSTFAEGQSELDSLDIAIANFSKTLADNPGLSAVISPQLETRENDKLRLLEKLSNSINGLSSEKPNIQGVKKEIESLELILSNLNNTLQSNAALSAVIQPQIDLKQGELSLLRQKLKSSVPNLEFAQEGKDIELIETGIRAELEARKGLLSEANAKVEDMNNQLEIIKKKVDELDELKSEVMMRIERLTGLATTELVESNESLRLVYKRKDGDNGQGQLVDSLPNEVPLYRERDIYTLGVEALLSYYGLDSENISISEDGSKFSIFNKSGDVLIEAPLEENQWVEVNWFSRWKEDSVVGSLLLEAKKAYAVKDYKTYRRLMPEIFSKILAELEDIELPQEISDYPMILQGIGIGSEEIEITQRLLSAKTSNDELPDFEDLSKVQEAIAYYFIPQTLKSKYNPMCGMKDIIQYSRFHETVRSKIIEIERKIQLLEGPTALEKINAALIKDPQNKNYKEQQKKILDAIKQNKQNLDVQIDEMNRIKDFFSYFEDAIIMVGPEEKTFNDLAPTPFDKSATPKVAVHGNLVKTLSSGIYIKRLPLQVDHAATLGVGILMAFLAVYQGRGASWVQAAGIVLLLGYLFMGFVTFSNSHVVWPITAPACAGISTSFIGLAVMVVIEQKAKGRLKGMFGSYVSSELVDQMVESGEEPSLGGQETPITAFFSDVQAFSSFSELLSPTGLVDLMNEYLTAMTNILQEERGTLDKYIGDAIVAMYGAPIPMDDHAYQSVRTAILMQQEQIKLREKWSYEEKKWGSCHGLVTKMQTRIGCNTGTATVGNMGALDRFNYTMMGDMVNLAARCESGAKAYGAYIMITEETKIASEKTRDDIAFRYLDRIVVKGRKQPVAMYEPTGFMSELSQETQDCLDCFKKGIDKYLLQDWDGALGMFEKAKNLEPNKPGVTPGVADNPSIILIDRCKVMKENPPGSDWDGVYVMTSK